MLFELDSNNLNSKNHQILGVASTMSHMSKINIWGFLKMILSFFQSITKETETNKRKLEKVKEAQLTWSHQAWPSPAQWLLSSSPRARAHSSRPGRRGRRGHAAAPPRPYLSRGAPRSPPLFFPLPLVLPPS